MDAVARVRKAVRRDLSIEPADSLAPIAVRATTRSPSSGVIIDAARQA
jgi:hypothetical protein